MENSELKENLKAKNQWVRLIFMILFMLFFQLAAFVAFWVVVFQFLHAIVTGHSNDNLQSFGSSLSAYLADVVSFLTYNTEDKPYPFSAWPEAAKKPKKRTTRKSTAAKKPE